MILGNVAGMTSQQYDAILQILRSMNERLDRIEQAAAPEVEKAQPFITRRLILITGSVAVLTIGVYIGFNILLDSLLAFIPAS